MGKTGAGISEHEDNMLIISYIFNVLEVECNRGIMSTPLGDAILPCKELKIIKIKIGFTLEKCQAHNLRV